LLRREPTLLLFVLVCAGLSHAQYEVPDEIFQRTLLIRNGTEHATAFKLEQAGRIYLVTTRHFGKSLPLTKAMVQVWRNRKQDWDELQTVRTFFPDAKDVDLAIIETVEQAAKPYSVVKTAEVLTTGEKVWFMGWLAKALLPKQPPNMPKTQRPIFPEIPNLVKLGAISAINPTQPDSFEITCQGWCAPDIAGGPVIYWSSAHKDFEVLGVIKRSQLSNATASSDGIPGQPSRFRAYSIDTVVEVIEAKSRAEQAR